jgi:hypothetical protein
MQQLVDARGAQPHCRGDLSDRQAHVMRSGDGGDSLLFGRLQTVSGNAQAMGVLVYRVGAARATAQKRPRPAGCLTSQRLSTTLDALA